MKRLFSLVLTVLTACCLAAPAFADVIWEPEDDFYQRHADECELLQRSFYTNGPEGYVDLFRSPESSSVTGQMENGEKLYIYWRYQDWGYVEGDVTGWAPLGDLQLIYDHISFAEEYGEQFAPYDAEACRPLLDAWTGDALALWPYPGAEQADLWQDAADAMEDLKEYGFSEIFVDEEGNTWGFCAYLYGNRDFWVCLDDPGRTAFPVRDVGQPELTAAREPELPASYYLPFTLGIVIAVGAVWLLAKKFLPRPRRRL